MRAPLLVVLAGPNGAGKSTTAPELLRRELGVSEFVNADDIAKGLSGFAPETVAFRAGRIMLERFDALAMRRADFAVETTLSGLTLARKIRDLKTTAGYRCHIVFLYLPSADLAVRRVAFRVQDGGHDVPELVIRRRYEAGLRNFFGRYRALADGWQFYDSSGPGLPRRIAWGSGSAVRNLNDPARWGRLQEKYDA